MLSLIFSIFRTSCFYALLASYSSGSFASGTDCELQVRRDSKTNEQMMTLIVSGGGPGMRAMFNSLTTKNEASNPFVGKSRAGKNMQCGSKDGRYNCKTDLFVSGSRLTPGDWQGEKQKTFGLPGELRNERVSCRVKNEENGLFSIEVIDTNKKSLKDIFEQSQKKSSGPRQYNCEGKSGITCNFQIEFSQGAINDGVVYPITINSVPTGSPPTSFKAR